MEFIQIVVHSHDVHVGLLAQRCRLSILMEVERDPTDFKCNNTNSSLVLPMFVHLT